MGVLISQKWKNLFQYTSYCGQSLHSGNLQKAKSKKSPGSMDAGDFYEII